MCTVLETVDFNRPDDVIRFVVDNNPEAVKANLSAAGLLSGGMTPCMMKDKLIALNNSGYNVLPILRVAPNYHADNYTAGIVAQYFPNMSSMRSSSPIGPNPDGTNLADTYDSGGNGWGAADIGGLLAGLGAGIGSIFGGGSSQQPVIVQTPKQDYLPFIILGVVILVAALMFKK